MNLDEFSQAESPARELLERLGWRYLPHEILAAERRDEREVLLKGRLARALLRLNEWMTEEHAERIIFELENLNATGMARNQAVHEYLTYGMPLSVDEAGGARTRIARFFDFEHPDRGLRACADSWPKSVDLRRRFPPQPIHQPKRLGLQNTETPVQSYPRGLLTSSS